MVSVTNLLKLLNKPGLLYWANGLGLEGVNIRDYKKQSTGDGVEKHAQVEDYLKHGIDFPEREKLEKCLSGYKIEGIEHNAGNDWISGRCDLILSDKDNKKIIVDFKSNSRIYLDQRIQLSTYKEILKADKVAIINFYNWKLNFLELDTEKYYNIIKHLYVIDKNIKELGDKL